MTRFFLFLLALSAAANGFAASADTVSIQQPYVRLMPPNAPATAAFMVIRNDSDKSVSLVGASSPAARRTEIHTHLHENGVMKMRQLPALEIKARDQAVLQPGGLHLMLIDLVAPLSESVAVPVKLDFQDGSSKVMELRVRRPGDIPTVR